MPFKPVDAAIKVIVGPAIDDGDFKAREETIAFNQAGMEVDVILEKYDGTIVTTAVVPTAAGDYDWVHTDQGYYSLELPAAAGASFNNTEEGIITVVVYCTGVLPFRSVSYDIIESQAYNALIKGTDALQVDAVEISGDATAANNAELAFDGNGYGFTGCTMPTVTTLTGHTAQTGDNFARIGAPVGASISADLVVIDNFVDDLETRLSAARAGYLDELAAANIPADIDTLLTRISAARAGYLDELAAANLPTDIANIKAETALIVEDTNELQTDWTNGGRLDLILDIIAQDTTTDIPATITTMQGNVTDILGDTSELQGDWVNGGRLDLLLDARALEATVAALNNISTADLATALTDIKLDHLIAVADGDDPVNGSIIAMLAASDGDWSGFAIANDSLEAIRDRGDAAWTTGAGGTVPSLLQNTTIATLASQTSFTLTAGSVDDNAYNGAIIVTTDAVSGVQKAVGRISDYIGASKTITLQEDPGIFTMAVGDTVDIIATDKLFIGYTDTRAGYLDELAAANIPSDIDSLLTRLTAARAGYLDNLNGHIAQTGDSFAIVNNGTHGNAALETLVDEIETILKHATYGNSALQVLLADIPTNAEFDARTLLAADYFDFTTDSVVVGTNNDKTGYALSNVGADLIIKTSTFALAMADATWDEMLTGATHNIATSAGRRVRELGAYHITSGTAQGGAAHSITLAAADTAADHIYNRNLLVILAGTGVGQTRTIVDYNGTTKVAVIDRDWWITPDATSEYTIIPDDTPIVADHGVARGGSGTTITLRTSASAISSTYEDLVIFIMAGTGAGQARLIDTYDGATNIATIHGTWTTNPDVTSVYALISSGTCHVIDITPAALAQIKTQADDALTDVHLDDLIQLALTVNDGAPNAADFITSSAIAVDDWYNENMLLFTSGALAGLARFVDDYDGATKRIYLAEAFPQAPANTDAFVIVGVSGSAPTATAVADAVWDELEAGHTIAGSFGEEVTKQGKKLDRNLILDL